MATGKQKPLWPWQLWLISRFLYELSHQVSTSASFSWSANILCVCKCVYVPLGSQLNGNLDNSVTINKVSPGGEMVTMSTPSMADVVEADDDDEVQTVVRRRK